MRLAGVRAGVSLGLSGGREDIEHATAGAARAPPGNPAQQLAGGDLGDAMPLDETLRLSALARAGRAQQNDAHGCRDETDPGSRERLATLPAAHAEVKRQRLRRARSALAALSSRPILGAN